MTDPEITQADRDAVNAFHSASFTALFNNGSDKRTAGVNLNAAHALLLEAFARHRMLGRAEGAAQERARIVAFARNFCFFTDIDKLRQMTKQEMSAHTCRELADAIERGEYKRSE